jgi:hypothetical protein
MNPSAFHDCSRVNEGSIHVKQESLAPHTDQFTHGFYDRIPGLEIAADEDRT